MDRTTVPDTIGLSRTDTPSPMGVSCPVVRSMKESDLQTGVIDLAHALGWRVAHFRPARTAHGWRTPVAADGAGFPDLVLVRRTRIVAAELKSDRGRLSDVQRDWLEALYAAGVETHVWTPAEYPDRIAEVLR